MSKLNKKGFMLAEVVVVSVVIAVTLVALFTGLSRVSKAYEKRDKYYDIDAEYLCIEANKALIKNNKTNFSNLTNINDQSYIGGLSDYISKFYNSDYITKNKPKVSIYYSPSQFTSVESIKTKSGTNQTFKDYIDYLKNNIDWTEYKYVIISEVCRTQDDCGYYTLKVEGE